MTEISHSMEHFEQTKHADNINRLVLRSYAFFKIVNYRFCPVMDFLRHECHAGSIRVWICLVAKDFADGFGIWTKVNARSSELFGSLHRDVAIVTLNKITNHDNELCIWIFFLQCSKEILECYPEFFRRNHPVSFLSLQVVVCPSVYNNHIRILEFCCTGQKIRLETISRGDTCTTI